MVDADARSDGRSIVLGWQRDRQGRNLADLRRRVNGVHESSQQRSPAVRRVALADGGQEPRAAHSRSRIA
jgi:hypothetical protein